MLSLSQSPLGASPRTQIHSPYSNQHLTLGPTQHPHINKNDLLVLPNIPLLLLIIACIKRINTLLRFPFHFLSPLLIPLISTLNLGLLFLSPCLDRLSILLRSWKGVIKPRSREYGG